MLRASSALDSAAAWAGLPALAQQLPGAPRMSQARAAWLHEIEVSDEAGRPRRLRIPTERALSLYVDRSELLTLMTLGVAPELLALGYLLNQRLIHQVSELASISVDWEVAAAAVRSQHGLPALQARSAQRVATTGCGQGTVFGGLQDELAQVVLPTGASSCLPRAQLWALLETMRQAPSLHREAGSVHGAALFQGERRLAFVEDVGRHNAIDTLAGWMGLYGVSGADKVLYTTGRLTSEMVMKAALMGLPIVVSRNGVTHMGHALACQLGMTLVGRAVGKHFLCYCGAERIAPAPAPAAG